MHTRVVLTRSDLKALQLPANPFPDLPAGHYWYPELTEILEQAEEVAYNHGMMAIVGPSGAGKSTLLAQIRENLEAAGNTTVVDSTLMNYGRLSDWAIEVALLRALNVPRKKVPGDPQERREMLIHHLNRRIRHGRRMVVLFDDFHGASSGLLKKLRALREAGWGGYISAFIFAGQPALLGTLYQEEMKEVLGRMLVSHVPPLGGTDRHGHPRPNHGEAFLRWHFDQIGVSDMGRYITSEAARAIADIAEYPLWVKNLATWALKKVSRLGHPVDPRLLSKLLEE